MNAGMLFLLLACAHAPSPHAPTPREIRRIELLDGEPWLVGAESTSSDGPWTAKRGPDGLWGWTAAGDVSMPDAPAGSVWVTEDTRCEVVEHAVAAVAYVTWDQEAPVPAEPECGQPRIWGRLRCDAPPAHLLAVREGAPVPIAAWAAGTADDFDFMPLITARPGWKTMTVELEREAAQAEIPTDREVEGLRGLWTRYNAARWRVDHQGWVVVEAQQGWGEGSPRCGGTGGLRQLVAVYTDTRPPRLVSEAWSVDEGALMDVVVVDGVPIVRHALDGTEYLGADHQHALYGVDVCICGC